MKRVRYELAITETSGAILHPAYETDLISDPGQSWVEDFFGCHDSDVAHFTITCKVLD